MPRTSPAFGGERNPSGRWLVALLSLSLLNIPSQDSANLFRGDLFGSVDEPVIRMEVTSAERVGAYVPERDVRICGRVERRHVNGPGAVDRVAGGVAPLG